MFFLLDMILILLMTSDSRQYPNYKCELYFFLDVASPLYKTYSTFKFKSLKCVKILGIFCVFAILHLSPVSQEIPSAP